MSGDHTFEDPAICIVFEEGPDGACLETGGERHGHPRGKWDIDLEAGVSPGLWVQKRWRGLQLPWAGRPGGPPLGQLPAPPQVCI